MHSESVKSSCSKMLRMGSSLSISSRDLHRLYGPVMTCDMCSGSSSFTSDLIQCPSFVAFKTGLTSLGHTTSFQLQAMLSRCPCSVCWAAVGSDAMSKPRVQLIWWSSVTLDTYHACQVHYPTISMDMLEQVPYAAIALLIAKDHQGNMAQTCINQELIIKYSQISVAALNKYEILF